MVQPSTQLIKPETWESSLPPSFLSPPTSNPSPSFIMSTSSISLQFVPFSPGLFSVLLHLSIHSEVIEFSVTFTVSDSGETMVNKTVEVSVLMTHSF